MDEPDRELLETAHCWENVDRVPGDPAMTAFKRWARLRQAQWREERELPIGAQALRAGGSRAIGSRIDADYARATGANFITEAARGAVDARLSSPQPHQTLDERRLYSDLLSSMPMCFNLLGDLHAEAPEADRIAHLWWDDLPGPVTEMAFEWSPGRRDPLYLNNRTAFDACLLLNVGDRRGVVGVETKYHEHPIKETKPGPNRLPRYLEVSERSGLFGADAIDRIVESPLQQIWLDHLLVLAMLQHPSGAWTWGRFVLIHPAGNTAFSALAAEYRSLLSDDTTFDVRTIEDLLGEKDGLPEATRLAFRGRYLPDAD